MRDAGAGIFILCAVLERKTWLFYVLSEEQAENKNNQPGPT